MERFSELSSEKQIQIREKILNLQNSGLGYKRIIKRIAEEDKIKIPLSTLSYWFNNEVKMLGGKNYFKAEPSPELSYIIGCMHGDASISFNEKKQEYNLSLSAIDKDFVEKFSFSVSKLLRKEKNYPLWKCARGHIYNTHIRCKELYNFIKEIKKDFEKAKPFIEKHPKEFVQGLADSEGCAQISAGKKFECKVVIAYSTNLPLLKYTKELLKNKFRINSNLILHKRKGITDSIIDGRPITRILDVYRLYINRNEYISKFISQINFAMQRKKERIETGFFILQKYSRKKGPIIWKQIYKKRGNFWVKKNPNALIRQLT